MKQTYKLRNLYRSLQKDVWRKTHDFSSDMKVAHEVLWNPFATPEECEEMFACWLQKPRTSTGPGHQSCLFGRIAAKNAMHYCVLNENVLVDSDQEIQAVLSESLRAWKRRSVDPRNSSPAHGFMVFLVSRRLAEAAPDAHLLEYVSEFRRLWGCEQDKDPAGNDISVETLYLRKPSSTEYVRFTFSIDYFGAQGDGRWWHDHRIPGGVAFTANSAGHMAKYHEWYQQRTGQNEWLLQTAMRTIDEACSTPFGRATWLRELRPDGKPFLEDVRCPVAPDKVQTKLQGKDWTKYGGHLYSDHSVRTEFFRPEPEKPAQLAKQSWLEDFTYLYDATTADHVKFIQGEAVSLSDVEMAIGKKSEWRMLPLARETQLINSSQRPAPPEIEANRIAAALSIAREWSRNSSD